MNQPLCQPDPPAEQPPLPADSGRTEIDTRESRWGATIADARLASGHASLKRWLMAILRYRYRLPFEDCEEIVNDVLLAWHRQLRTPQAVRNDRAFCVTVLRSQAINRLRRRTVQTVELSLIDNLAVDLEVDVLVAERDELRVLNEVAMEVLEPREYAIVRLVASGVHRAKVAKWFGLRPRQVRRVHDRARSKLAAARAQLEEQGKREGGGDHRRPPRRAISAASTRGAEDRPGIWRDAQCRRAGTTHSGGAFSMEKGA